MKTSDGLWEAVTRGIPQGFELDERETAQPDLAARQADDLARLEVVIAEQGATAVGPTGQRVVHPAISEAQHSRLAISRLLGALALGEEDGDPGTAASRRGRRAARARWGAAR
jgi:hypothetical protein